MMKLQWHQSVLLASMCWRPRSVTFSRAFHLGPEVVRKTFWNTRKQCFQPGPLQFQGSRRCFNLHPIQKSSLRCSFQDSVEECWAATSWMVNAADNTKINDLVRCFNSPAPQSFFAFTRALSLQSSTAGKEEVLRIFSTHLKRGYQFGIFRNQEGDLFDWTIVSSMEEDGIDEGLELVQPLETFPNTLSIAHHLLDLVTQASEVHQVIDQAEVTALVELAVNRLKLTLGTDIRSRSSADAAFAFAMAGVTNKEIYNLLTIISNKELRRVGPRESYPSKYILQIIEKLAAAGLRGSKVNEVYSTAAALLESKGKQHNDVVASLRSSKESPASFGLHSTRPLLWLWRFAARQTKAKVYKEPNLDIAAQGQSSSSWVQEFEDSSRDLVVDVGGGMGVSLLGLSTLTGGNQKDAEAGPVAAIDYANCNFIGCDLSQLLVGYSSSIAKRWNLSSKVQFVCKPAEQFLEDVASYPGNVRLIMVQFPTPFRLPKKQIDGNSQLPSPSGFMVSENLLQSIARILKRSSGGGHLLIQSNCEDVAVFMRDLAVEKVGMTSVDAPCPVSDLGTHDNLPQRSREWIAMGGKRPMDDSCWSSKALLPRKGQTETEVACDLQGTPVHRCLLRVPSD